MFKSMKLATKITTGFVAVTLLAAAMGLVGLWGLRSAMGNLAQIGTDSLPSVQSLLILSESMYKVVATERGLINRRMSEPQFRTAQYEFAERALKRADAAWKVYEPLSRDQEEDRLWKEVAGKWDAWKKSHQQLEELSREKDRLVAAGVPPEDPRVGALEERAFQASLESRKHFLVIEEPLTKLVEINVKAAQEANVAGQADSRRARALLIAAIVCVLVLATGITLFLKGNVAAILKGLMNESDRLSQAGVNGQLATRADLERVNFEFRGVLDGMNQTLDAVIGPLNMGAEYVDRISKGDIPPKVTDNYNGDFNELKNNLNVLVASMQTVTEVAARIAVGDLEVEVKPRSDSDQLMLALKGMVAQLKGVALSAERIAAGDLTVQVRPASEQDAIGNAFVTMVENLREIVGRVSESTESIATASRQIATGNSDLAQRTEEQASSLEETAASMEELTSTVKQNAENAQQANQLAIVASDVAVKGGGVIGKVVETMDSISDSSKKIADIIGVIDGIAFQTNILALNAAVEAARAGEQGRGFAVVAGEVRNLAQRSAAAAKEIKALIGDSVNKVDSGSKLVGEAGETMQEIVTSIKRVTDIMGEISAASVEQSSGIEQVNTAVTQMDEITQQNSSVVQQAASAAGALQEQAELLVEAVSRFTLDETPAGRKRQPASPPEAKQVTLRTEPKRANGYHKAAKGRTAGSGEQDDRPHEPLARAVGDDGDWSSF